MDKTDTETDETIKQIVESTFNMKAHNTNYFLPVSYRYDGKYPRTNFHKANAMEVEFQVSFKFDITQDLMGLGETYSAAYTQHSFWQLYTKSAYFRESNYNPEFFVTFPTDLSGDMYGLKAIRVSFAHQSNGRGGREERSWNYISSSFTFQYKYLFTELKLWTSWNSALKYNPDLLDYLGHGHLKFRLPYKKHLFEVKLRDVFDSRAAMETSYSYPLLGRSDLFFYAKTFNGYGESLIDYDNNVNKVGFGFSISR